jgi:multiple sugar transport system substrate-binding protein
MSETPWRRRLLAMSAAMVLVVAACSGDNSGGGASAGAGGESPSTAAESPSTGGESPSGAESPSGGGEGAFQCPTNNVELTVWNPFTGPDGNFFSQIVDDFNAATPTVKVTVQTQPGAEYTQRLEAAAAANQLPHVIAAGYDALPLLNENGIVVPIDDFAQTGGYDASMFPEAIWNAGQWKDQRVGIPIDTHPMILYYNKKLFTDAGLDPEAPPTDKASFEAAIKAIQEKTDADGLQMVASGPGANFLVGILWATLFYQGGGEWTNADFSEATFNSEAGVQASTYLKQLVDEMGVPKVESDAELNAFTQGKNAMMFNGIWQTSAAKDALGDDLGVAPVPNFFGDGTWGGSHNLAVTAAAADGDLKQAAYCFIDWFSQNSLNWGAAGQVPARNDVREQVTEGGEGLLSLVSEVVPLAETVRFLPSIPGGGDLLFIANGAGEAATLAINGSDPKQTLDAAATFNSDVLKQNKERYGF